MAGKHSRRPGKCQGRHLGPSRWGSRLRLKPPGEEDHTTPPCSPTPNVRSAEQSALAERHILDWLTEEETMQVNLAIAAALVGAGVMVGGPAVAQGRPQDSYALAEAAVPVQHAAVPARVDVPAGTPIPVKLDEEIPIDKERIGDVFSAHVSRDVKVNGKVAIPSGSEAKVRLTQSREKSDAATLRLTEVEIHRD